MAKPGRHSDGGGLYLAIGSEGRRSWTFMYTWRGKQREAGLGSASKGGVSLKAAREKAAEGRAMLETGVDPLAEWNKADPEEVPTFGKAADDFLATHEGGFRNEKHKAQWRMTLTRYCEPIRDTPVDAIDTEAVLSVLKPLWTRAPETASRLRGRIERSWTQPRRAASSMATEANPARWRGHLDKLLPKRAKLPRGHHAAMPYRRRSGFRRRASASGRRPRPAPSNSAS